MLHFKKEYTEKNFPVFVHEGKKPPRIAFLSDTHNGDNFNGVGGVSREERHDFMIKTLIENKESFDCVVFNGDMACRNAQECWKQEHPGKPLPVKNSLLEAKEDYFDRLIAAGIPYFAVHASHDSLVGDEFYRLFGYENHYALLFGNTAFLMFDLFSGERSPEIYMQTNTKDIPSEIADAALAFLSETRVNNAFVVVHYPFSNMQEFCRVVANKKVVLTFAGHSHYNDVDRFLGKPMLQTGHFSRANMRLKTWGLDFKPFVSVAANAPTVIDEQGNPHPDYSKTGSPWQYRMLTCQKDGSFESYMVFPEREYFSFTAEGCQALCFHQPYAEARPAFLGKEAPIDKSYFNSDMLK